MKMSKWILIGSLTTGIAALTVWALVGETRTFRTHTQFVGISQDTNLAGKPQYEIGVFNGRDLVNLALGAPLGSPRTNEVLALEITCDSSAAQLVVYDKTLESNIAVIATSARMDVVQAQASDAAAYPNRERFVAHLNVIASGGLQGGYLTVAGRLFLDPQTGCPRAVLVDSDKALDKICGDGRDPKNTEDDDRLVRFAGRAHYIGVLDVTVAGNPATVLVPHGRLAIRRQLLP